MWATSEGMGMPGGHARQTRQSRRAAVHERRKGDRRGQRQQRTLERDGDSRGDLAQGGGVATAQRRDTDRQIERAVSRGRAGEGRTTVHAVVGSSPSLHNGSRSDKGRRNRERGQRRSGWINTVVRVAGHEWRRPVQSASVWRCLTKTAAVRAVLIKRCSVMECIALLRNYASGTPAGSVLFNQWVPANYISALL
ncbi:hypothetical protein MRX96_015436 [Rhipicephalus microplus]